MTNTTTTPNAAELIAQLTEEIADIHRWLSAGFVLHTEDSAIALELAEINLCFAETTVGPDQLSLVENSSPNDHPHYYAQRGLDAIRGMRLYSTEEQCLITR